MADGAEDADTALRRTLKVIQKNEKRKLVLKARRQGKHSMGASLSDRTSSPFLYDWRNRQGTKKKQLVRKIQPHGLCTAVPIYIMLGLFARTLFYPLLKIIPGGNTWVLPALVQLNKWMLVFASVLTGKLLSALPILTRQKQYILF